MAVNLAALVGLTEDDAAQLRTLKVTTVGDMEAVINAFYDRILSFPAFKEMIERTCARDNIDIGQLVAHINSVQFAHWQRFFDGVPDQAFQDSARKIGAAHEKCLLTSDLYVGSSAIILESFVARAVTQHLGTDEHATRLNAALAAVIRMFFLDLSHAISAYDSAASLTVFKQIPGRS